ncbi:MAG: hypothetical protein ABSF53_19590 [Terracidiphilus sp.]|jgi:hypothetical protein
MPDRIQIDTPEALGTILNERLASYLSDPRNSVVKQLFAAWTELGWKAYIFGGMLRDVTLFANKANPRDIDIVVSNKSLNQLKRHFSKYILRETRFGGLHIQIADIKFDIWPLQQTWAFGNTLKLSPKAINLPRTTFLNVEGIVAELPNFRTESKVFEYGFIKAINSRELDINLTENPYPALSAIRSIITARKLKFKLSIALRKYILHAVESEGLDALVDAQLKHYSTIILKKDALRKEVSKLGEADHTPQIPRQFDELAGQSAKIER